MYKFICTFIREEDGAAAAEYALLLALIAAGMAVAATALGSAVTGALDQATDCINNGPNCNPVP